MLLDHIHRPLPVRCHELIKVDIRSTGLALRANPLQQDVVVMRCIPPSILIVGAAPLSAKHTPPLATQDTNAPRRWAEPFVNKRPWQVGPIGRAPDLLTARKNSLP